MKNVKRLFVTLILVVLANLMVQVPAYAKPHFNKHDVLFLKKGKSKTVKIKGLSKKQQKKKWKFECSDKRVATIKQKGKYGFTGHFFWYFHTICYISIIYHMSIFS